MIPPAPEAWLLHFEAAVRDKDISCHDGSLAQVLWKFLDTISRSISDIWLSFQVLKNFPQEEQSEKFLLPFVQKVGILLW